MLIFASDCILNTFCQFDVSANKIVGTLNLAKQHARTAAM